MNLMKVHKTFQHLKTIRVRRLSNAALPEENEYTDTPVYPRILDNSLKQRKLRDRQGVYEKIKQVGTVEEKQIALNMPRYYGWRCVMLNEYMIPYNVMPLVQCYTRSHFKLIDKFPDIYTETVSMADTVVNEIKSLIEDAIIIENERHEQDSVPTLNSNDVMEKENNLAKKVVKQINRIIINNLSDRASHILSSQVDYDPRHEAFWFVGGVDVPTSVVKWRKQYNWFKKRALEPINRPVQYIGSPFLTVRNRLPLRPIMPYKKATNSELKVQQYTTAPERVGYEADFRHGTNIPGSPFLTVRNRLPLRPIMPYKKATNSELKVQQYTTAPERVGYEADFRHGTNIPGYWPGDFDEFGLLSYHGRGHITVRNESYGEEDHLEALHCQAMTASFGWLLAQANYQGFTTYNDLTYPLVTQTVITNGQLISFYIYQLNTIVVHNDEIKRNPRHNVCYGTKPLKLYETIENGKVKGLNEDVLKMLVQFYLNEPQERKHEMKPFLNTEEGVVADIEDDKRRCWLENTFKHIASNRPRHYLTPEIYLWERMYKIEHNTRFIEAKRRPFELGINPFQRRLDQHLPPYIPKVLRPYPKCRKKFEDTYYPKV